MLEGISCPLCISKTLNQYWFWFLYELLNLHIGSGSKVVNVVMFVNLSFLFFG